ncbi:MAG TPA: AAA family ATPase [Candidatus Binatia bacterium]|nr:AAA family ATPase [Candidatus Binatia bacterium]
MHILRKHHTVNNHVLRFHIITGGPGSGKSSIIEGLRQRGFASAPEAGRAIIQDQMAIEGRALPWADRMLFAELMLSWDIRSYRLAAEHNGPVFFDRGIPDVLGYLRLSNLSVPEHMNKAAAVFPYNPTVFVAPPWKEIFHQDRERKQDFNEAVRTYEALASMYEELGYELVGLPQGPVDDRVGFILGRVGAARLL